MNKLILGFITISFLATCTKDNSSNDPTGQEVLTMNVNGIPWTADDNLSGFKFKTNNKAQVGGKKIATDETLVISNVEITGTGTYNINLALTQNISFLRDGTSPKIYLVSSTFPSSRASITITKINESTTLLDHLEGIFSAVLYRNATDSVVITNGIFKFN